VDIRTELEHANVKVMPKSELNDDVIAELSKEYHVLMVCDLSKGDAEENRAKNLKALVAAELIPQDAVEGILAEDSLMIVIPFLSMQIAEQDYRRIAHASHFVKMYLDGKPYAGACGC
jgi:hypothetical protein